MAGRYWFWDRPKANLGHQHKLFMTGSKRRSRCTFLLQRKKEEIERTKGGHDGSISKRKKLKRCRSQKKKNDFGREIFEFGRTDSILDEKLELILLKRCRRRRRRRRRCRWFVHFFLVKDKPLRERMRLKRDSNDIFDDSKKIIPIFFLKTWAPILLTERDGSFLFSFTQ